MCIVYERMLILDHESVAVTRRSDKWQMLLIVSENCS